MPLLLTQAPAEEPLTLAEAKIDMRVDEDFTDHDALIEALITAAREYAELICRRALITQKWQLTLDQFPAPNMNIGSANWYGPQWGNTPGPLTTLQIEGRSGSEIWLPVSPVQSIESVTYIDSLGALQTLANTEYKLDKISSPARVVPAYGKAWPSTRNEINAVQVNFTSGYGAQADVPRGIRAAIIMHCKAHYEATFDEVTNAEYERRLRAVDALLQPYRVLVF